MGISRKFSSRKGRDRKRIKAELRNILEHFLYISLHFYAYFPTIFILFLISLQSFLEIERKRQEKTGISKEASPESNKHLGSFNFLSEKEMRRKREKNLLKSLPTDSDLTNIRWDSIGKNRKKWGDGERMRNLAPERIFAFCGDNQNPKSRCNATAFAFPVRQMITV